MACEVRCVAKKLQRLIPRVINNRCHLIFSFILPALSTALSLLSSRRSDLFTALGCDVHGHTTLAVHRAGAGRRSATGGLSRVPK